MSPAGVVREPDYDRAEVRAGIVHIGVGSFHRAHQAVAIDDLLAAPDAAEWGICGVGVLPGDQRMRDVLRASGGRYTLVLRHGDGRQEARRVDSIVEYLFAPDDPGAVIARLCDPAIRLVTLTITEGGYGRDPVTGEFLADAPDVVYDLADPDQPRTVFGLLTEALRRRRAAGTVPFTVLSCDNIQSNGEVARRAFIAFARLRDPELADWISTTVAFPNAMVDRITPATTDEDRRAVEATFGVADEWPVVAEPFFQWVVEDRFPAGRPPLERAGVQLVDDVLPYELMKLRLLNASHQGLCYFARLLGYHFVHDAASDPLIARFLRRYMDEEATPTLLEVAGVDLDAYKASLLERFANPQVRDTVDRLCTDGSDRIPQWLVPVIRARLDAGAATPLAAAIVASWARFAEGTDERGEPIDIVDRRREQLLAHGAPVDGDPLAFLRQPDLFGDLVDRTLFTRDYERALTRLRREGARATLLDFAD